MKKLINYLSNKKHFWWITGSIWLFSVCVIICTHFYNQYLNREYLKGKKLDLISALSILGDPSYLHFFFLGLFFVLLLVFTTVISIVVPLKNSRFLSEYIYILIFGFMVSVVLLVILIIEYNNPIFMAFAIASGIGGMFFVGQD